MCCMHLFRLNAYQALGYKLQPRKEVTMALSPLPISLLLPISLSEVEFPHPRITATFISKKLAEAGTLKEGNVPLEKQFLYTTS